MWEQQRLRAASQKKAFLGATLAEVCWLLPAPALGTPWGPAAFGGPDRSHPAPLPTAGELEGRQTSAVTLSSTLRYLPLGCFLLNPPFHVVL